MDLASVEGRCASAADSWAGCDRTAAFKLRVAEQTRAEKEGRTGGAKARSQQLPVILCFLSRS